MVSTAATAAEKELFGIATQMKNFVYLVGDRRTGEAVVIDGVCSAVCPPPPPPLMTNSVCVCVCVCPTSPSDD